MSIHQQYIQTTSLPVSARYTTKTMLQGHGPITKRYVHRNSTSNAINLDGNLFYTATASNNASINTATGVTSSSYGYASAMPIALPVAIPSSTSMAAISQPGDIPNPTINPVMSENLVVPQTINTTSSTPVACGPAQELHFCLPPSLPSSYRSYMPLSVYTRQKEVLSAPASRGAIGDEDLAVKVADRLKIYHLTSSSLEGSSTSTSISTIGNSSNGNSRTGMFNNLLKYGFLDLVFSLIYI